MAKAVSVFFVLLAVSFQLARAELRSPNPVASLGEVRSGVRLTQRFSLSNDGTVPIQIVDVKTTCGCMKPRLTKEALGPGEATELSLEINTLSAAAGLQSWRVRVIYHEGTQTKELSFMLTGRVIREVTIEPTSLAVLGDDSSSRDITVTDIRPQPLPIRTVQTTSAHLAARLDEPRKNEQGYWTRVIHLEIDNQFAEGRHDEALDIVTDDPAYGTLRIPVTITRRVRQRVTASPESVSLRAGAGQPLPSRIVLLRDREDQPVIIDGISADHPALQCTSASGPGNAATLRIKFDRSRLSGERLQTEIHIEISQPIHQTITIPVSLTPDS